MQRTHQIILLLIGALALGTMIFGLLVLFSR
jgi:hypothetical protein